MESKRDVAVSDWRLIAVLIGVIGALLARGLPCRDALRLAAWAHGRAGDQLAAQRAVGWTAGDVAAAVPAALDELARRSNRPGVP